MDIVKKNLVSIICGVVALVALVAVFVWPLDGYYTDLHQRATARAAVYGKVDGLLKKGRSLPVLDFNHPEVAPLLKFPSDYVIAVGKQAQEKVKTESKRVYDIAWQLNSTQHGLNVPGSLPSPSAVVAINFRRNIQAAYDKLREELAAGVPPTPEERAIREGVIWQEIEKKQIVVGDQVTNLPQIMEEYNERKRKLPEEMKQEMATKYKVYMSQLLMRPPASLPERESANVLSIWWTQVGYWVSRDVAMAIKETNANARNVTEAPVKHLVNLVIREDFFPPITGQGGMPVGPPGGDPNAPATPATGGLPDPTVALPDGGPQTPTKRLSNNLYDVVQFSMTVDVEADQVPAFLKTLSTNRFITVTRLEMNPVDSQFKQIQGYVYGTKPVVTLDLDCEALFMREWTIKLMPDVIKRALGIPTGAVDPNAAPRAGLP
jgi:hypothetical protein